MLHTLRGLIAGTGKIEAITPTPEQKLITAPVRIASEGKGIELALGKQILRLYPETPIRHDAETNMRHWIVIDPKADCRGVAYFARLDTGQTIVVGRANPKLNKIFDFPKSVGHRHLLLANHDGQIIAEPLDAESKTYISSVPENADVNWLEARRAMNLKRLLKIFGGPIELLEPDSAIIAVEHVNTILANEAYRARDSQGRPGGLLELPEKLAPIIVGDIHAQVDSLLKILSLDACLHELERGNAYLLFLGDTVHREGEGELEEMDSSLLTLDLLFKLKIRFPKNVFFLRGNHECFDNEVGKGGIPQAELLWQHARALRGKKYVKKLAKFFEMLAYVAKSRDFLACHAGPPRSRAALLDLINIKDNPNLARELLWNRVRRTGRFDGYTKSDVKRFRKLAGVKKSTPLIVSHTPLTRTGTIWTDAGEIPDHHIIFSANPNRLAIFVRSSCEMLPLEYPTEPLLEFANSCYAD